MLLVGAELGGGVGERRGVSVYEAAEGAARKSGLGARGSKLVLTADS